MRLIHCVDAFSDSMTSFESHLFLLGLLARYGEDAEQYSQGVKFYTFFDLVESLESDRDCLSSAVENLNAYHAKNRKLLKSITHKI